MLKYSQVKIFHFKDKVDNLPKEKEVKVPMYIRIKSTNVCNHHCVENSKNKMILDYLNVNNEPLGFAQ